jgi:hypothetical protein
MFQFQHTLSHDCRNNWIDSNQQLIWIIFLLFLSMVNSIKFCCDKRLSSLFNAQDTGLSQTNRLITWAILYIESCKLARMNQAAMEDLLIITTSSRCYDLHINIYQATFLYDRLLWQTKCKSGFHTVT